MGGQHHQRHLTRLRIVQARAQHRDAIHARHAEIHKRHVDAAFAQPGQPVRPILGGDRRMPERAQGGLQGGAKRGIVIDDQDARHGNSRMKWVSPSACA